MNSDPLKSSQKLQQFVHWTKYRFRFNGALFVLWTKWWSDGSLFKFGSVPLCPVVKMLLLADWALFCWTKCWFKFYSALLFLVYKTTLEIWRSIALLCGENDIPSLTVRCFTGLDKILLQVQPALIPSWIPKIYLFQILTDEGLKSWWILKNRREGWIK